MSSADKVNVKVSIKNKTLVYIQLVITSLVLNSLDTYHLGPNCLEGLSTDDNVM